MNCKNADTAGNPCSTKTCPYCAVIRRKLPSVDALKEELRVTEQNLADCMARLHTYDCKVDALIADRIKALEAKGEPVACVECNGSGVDPVPRPVCCGNAENGECCGVPEPDWSRCERCEGSGFVDPPSIEALIAEIMDCEINGHYGDTGYDVGQVNAVIDKYRSAK